ncbi:hypothetical protein BJ912DRAFT_1141521 [Pholiota molesta]|nr:hypothetical protein BJ912DRAFT_1141521 [Pholiota molesta]
MPRLGAGRKAAQLTSTLYRPAHRYSRPLPPRETSRCRPSYIVSRPSVSQRRRVVADYAPVSIYRPQLRIAHANLCCMVVPRDKPLSSKPRRESSRKYPSVAVTLRTLLRRPRQASKRIEEDSLDSGTHVHSTITVTRSMTYAFDRRCLPSSFNFLSAHPATTVAGQDPAIAFSPPSVLPPCFRQLDLRPAPELNPWCCVPCAHTARVPTSNLGKRMLTDFNREAPQNTRTCPVSSSFKLRTLRPE